jgi:hypothetical protein
MSKTAGLFLRPSDLSSDHTSLASALEGRINNSPTGATFKKNAGLPEERLHGAMIGGTVAGVTQHIRNQYSKPSPLPPPEEVQGVVGKVRRKLREGMHEKAEFGRSHPVASVLLATTIGAGTGAYIGTSAIKRLKRAITRRRDT